MNHVHVKVVRNIKNVVAASKKTDKAFCLSVFLLMIKTANEKIKMTFKKQSNLLDIII